MKKLLMAAVAASALMLGASHASAAVTITFDGASNSQYSGPITRSGYVFDNPAGQEQHFHEINSSSYGYVSNGTSALLEDRDTQIEMQAADHSVFSLISFDFASASANNTTSYSVLGYLNGALVGTLTGPLGASYVTVSGLSLGSIDRVVFDGVGGNGFFELDNVTVGAGAVPEPATWAMLLMGFGMIGATLRRRRGIVATTA